MTYVTTECAGNLGGYKAGILSVRACLDPLSLSNLNIRILFWFCVVTCRRAFISSEILLLFFCFLTLRASFDSSFLIAEILVVPEPRIPAAMACAHVVRMDVPLWHRVFWELSPLYAPGHRPLDVATL